MSTVETITINSARRLAEFLREIQRRWQEERFLVVAIRSGKRRSRSQEALWAIWAREQIAPFMGWTEEQARMAMYHLFLGYEEVRISDKLVIKGQLRRFPRDHGEAFDFMTRVQQFWLSHNPPLVLESSGDFAVRQREAA